jgi:hypothetical protein
VAVLVRLPDVVKLAPGQERLVERYQASPLPTAARLAGRSSLRRRSFY